MKLSFSWIGLVVFLLPMLINVVYALCPPADAPKTSAPVTRWIEWIEKISRVAYLLALVLPFFLFGFKTGHDNRFGILYFQQFFTDLLFC